ncbi:stage V sporulation protein AC [Jeotgalibacillus proteolyticus]|uniref:Stage V sporulation protein AC n=1 Tax=Jeotgalibacillus proteolyticus TaxID=2082395 RepID=A0A2S5GGY5_9BACL|nr:stage V sporulation protein AC [Jeotgalibacillus proteolyticus]PPA72310.1 stage V sporulation protein AC [Jeotgalibacillus proteolyticus]
MKKKTEKQQAYQKLVDAHDKKRPVLINCLKAFWVGGVICMIGQAVTIFFITYFPFTEQTAGNPSVSVMIFFAMLLTGFGVYDRLGQYAGAGSAVPVTGFGNAVISAAIEHRTEGLVLGVGGNMFKLAGSVIVFGVAAAFFLGLIKTLLIHFGVIG